MQVGVSTIVEVDLCGALCLAKKALGIQLAYY